MNSATAILPCPSDHVGTTTTAILNELLVVLILAVLKKVLHFILYIIVKSGHIPIKMSLINRVKMILNRK